MEDQNQNAGNEHQPVPQSEPQQAQQQYAGGQVQLPNATAVLVLGIIAIPGCCGYGLVGLICGIIALVLASRAKALYDMNPAAYTPTSISNLKAGKVCAIVGICLSSLFLLYIIFIFAIYGTIFAGLFSAMPWEEMNNY